MIYVGVDDTDMPGIPGTNQFCRALVNQLSHDFRCRLIVRHQLLFDDRVPYTSQNSCASIQLLRNEKSAQDEAADDGSLEILKNEIRSFMRERFLRGSDPGFCVTTHVPLAIAEFGRRCQRELVTQQEARELAERHWLHLEGCGGTEDGVIGSLAAIGLASTGDDGRVVQMGTWPDDISGEQPLEALQARDVAVVCHVSNHSITGGTINVGKHLRPNYRDYRVVLYATQDDASPTFWQAVRLP